MEPIYRATNYEDGIEARVFKRDGEGYIVLLHDLDAQETMPHGTIVADYEQAKVTACFWATNKKPAPKQQTLI